MENRLTGATIAEFESMNNRAKRLWITKELGVKPTKKSIRKVIENPSPVNFLEGVAIAVLLVLMAWTWFKVGAVAVPFAEKTLEILGEHTQISDPVKNSFTVLTIVLFSLLSTPAVLYFKVLSHDERTIKEIERHPARRWYSYASLEYLTPRLPAWVTYASIGWLIFLSTQLKGSVFELYIPVLVEIALAQLVGEILDKNQKYNKLISNAYADRLKNYEARESAYETDPTFLRVLYMVLSEDLAKLKRRNLNSNREERVNAWLGEADEDTKYRVVSAEYFRQTKGTKFADAVLSPSTPVAVLTAEIGSTKRLPPAGQHVWTPESLLSDLLMRGITGKDDYNQARLDADYDTSAKPRAAWRGQGFAVSTRELLAQN